MCGEVKLGGERGVKKVKEAKETEGRSAKVVSVQVLISGTLT
jgi:hypothetical protein